MTIDTIICGIEPATHEPFRRRRFPIRHLVPGFVPMQYPRLLAPEPLGIILGAVPKCFILVKTGDGGLAGESGGGAKTRVSCKTLVIEPPPWSEVMVATPQSGARNE